MILRHRSRNRDMNCRQVARVLQRYLDDVTDEPTARRVARHLEACRDCGLEAETYRAIKDSLHRQGAPPDEVRYRLEEFMESLVEERPPAGPD